MSVISIPDRNEALTDAINQLWEHYLQYVGTVDELKKEIERKQPVRETLKGYSVEEIFQEILIRTRSQRTHLGPYIRQTRRRIIRLIPQTL